MTRLADQIDKGEVADKEATAWVVRINGGHLSRRDRRAFANWIIADPSNDAAYARAHRLWADLAEPAAKLGASGWHRAAPRTRSAWIPAFRVAAVVATVLVAFASAVIWRDAGLLDRSLADYSAAPGQSREIVLADGSKLLLGGDSAINVLLSGGERTVTLIRGRAWFDVIRDQERPFIVHSGDVDTRVLGTSFAVEGQGDTIVVTVESGLVEVSSNSEHTHLSAGHSVVVRDGKQGAVEEIDPELSLSWRRGMLVLDRAPLGRVIEELGRMSPGRVIMPEAALRNWRLSGVFRTDDVDAVLDAMRTGLGLKVVSAPGFVTLIYR